MKKIGLAQGSQAWLDLRREKITATDCAPILGVSRYKSARQVWMDKISPAPFFENDAMRRGKELEPEARAFFSEKHGCEYKDIVGVSDENSWQMASFDGWDEKSGRVLEVKCPGEAVFRRVVAGEEPTEYIYQCLHQMAVTGYNAVSATLAFYYKGWRGVETHEIPIARDEDTIKRIQKAEYKFFFDNVLGFKEPEAGALDYVEISDGAWLDLVGRWSACKRLLGSVEEEEAILRNEIISRCGENSSRGGGVQATKYLRRGSVDYSKIPELDGVDVNPYRKPTSEAWRLGTTKS